MKSEKNDSSENLSIHGLLSAQANKNADAPAILAPGRTPLTYGRLLSHVGDVAASLRSIGVERNDRVAIVLPNGPEMAVSFVAVAAAATSAPLNPGYRAKEFDYYLSDLNAKALIVQADEESPARQVARARGIFVIELSPSSNAEAGVFSLTCEEGDSHPNVAFAEPDDCALVLHTSGTTSRPKIVPLTHSNICVSANNIRNTLKLSENDRCLNIMPLFHIHGLMGALLSTLTAGGSIVCTPGFYAPEIFGWMEMFQPTWYSAVPTMHQAILERAKSNSDVIKSVPLRLIRSSSASLPPQVMAELEKAFNAPVIESYGMTEASHQMASNPLPPGERKPGSVGMAAGPDVAIMDNEGKMLPKGETGEIVIRGPNVTHGYENNPDANASAFTDGWFRTGDQGFIDDDGYLFVTGRLKEIINRGGEKISPREVDEVLMDHPAVVQAVAFGFPDKRLGEDIGAAIVLNNKNPATERDIREFAADRLADFKVPRRIVILDEIPKGPTGKLQRIGLAKTLGIGAQEEGEEKTVRPPFVAPRNAAEETLARVWAQLLNIDQVGIHDEFFALGGDSILAARLFARIEKEFGKALPLSTLFDAPAVEQLASVLSDDGWLPRWKYLVAIQPRGSKVPFFCVHPLSGNVLAYTDLARYLGPDQPFYALQAPGLYGDDRPCRRFEDMARLYIQEIISVQPEGPYILGGASATGGLVAYEMAQQLVNRGQEVSLLALIDVQSPPALRPPGSRPAGHRMSLFRYPRRNIKRIAANIKEWIVSDQQTRRFRKVESINERAKNQYLPSIYPGRILLVMSEEGPAWPQFDVDSQYGWGKLAGGGLNFHVFSADHASILKEPCVRGVAEQVRKYFDEVEARG